MSNIWSRWPARIVVGILAGSFFLFIGVPLVALLLREPPAMLWATMQQPEVRQALELSFLTTSISTFLTVLFGLPVAFVLARMQFRGRSLLETLVTLPIVFPPVVAGVALLLTFGRFGLVGRYLLLLCILPLKATWIRQLRCLWCCWRFLLGYCWRCAWGVRG